MSNELIVNTSDSHSRIVLIKGGDIVEYHQEEKDRAYNVGDIYLGSVKDVISGLNAAFIDIGRDAFLACSDISSQIASLQKFVLQATKKKQKNRLAGIQPGPPLEKDKKIDEILKNNNHILLRITKEPIASKPLRVSSVITLAGRYLVLIPFGSRIKFSKRIRLQKEKRRLERIVNSLKPNSFGIVVRKEAENQEEPALKEDLHALLSKWEEGLQALYKAKVGEKIIGELTRVSSILRDKLNEDFDKVIVDDTSLYEEIKGYVRKISPEKEQIVDLYKGKTPIFEHFDIEKEIKRLFSRAVNLKDGGYITIEETEAMHVIDVNSGRRTSLNGKDKQESQENMILNINLAAAKEIARQISLRPMGGIIIIDFISMYNPAHKKQLYQAVKDHMRENRAKVNVFPLTKLGLMQITCEKIRPPARLLSDKEDACLSCSGTGKRNTNVGVSEEIIDHLKVLGERKGIRKIMLMLHPYLYSYLSQGFLPFRWRWYWRYGKWVKMEKNSNLPLAFYRFVFLDERGEPSVIVSG